MTESETRIEPVIELLARLASGDFEARGQRSATDADLDAVMVGINMLAEELSAHRSELEERVASRTMELEAARAAALASSRLKSEFLATMSHEIRTPMNAVIGLTSLLQLTGLDEIQRQYADGVQSAGESLILVIDDILDFSKLEAGMVDLAPTDYEPRPVVEGVAALVAVAAEQKDLELIAYCLPQVPALLHGDEGRLRQILLNLASNAVKFTDQGEVVITARTVGDDGDGERLRYQVTDTGIGVPEEAHAQLFEPFIQADASTTRRFGGTGLGLAISRRLTEAMGGEIGVESAEGSGSTFWFEVPLIPVAGTMTGAGQRLDVLSGLRVLVVDDNATNRLVLASQLTSWGLRPDVIEYPRTAVPLMRAAVAAGDPYALVVLDMCMPDMDGAELAGLISRDAELGRTPMIMLSSATRVDEDELRRAGVHDWLSKPVRSAEFHERLTRLVAQRSPGRATAAAAGAALPVRVVAADRGRVLVAEDNSLNQLVAEGMLESLGYRVDLVANGLEALEAVAATRYTAVLMDCHMPVMDGFTATRRIRLLEGDGDRLPIVAMTAGAMSQDRDRCLSVGMDGYVSKPVNRGVLSEALTTWGRAQTAVDHPAVEPADHSPARAERSASVLDRERISILRTLGPDDGWGLFPAMTNAFSNDCPSILADLRHSHSTNDADAWRHAAHQLKGAAANMGAVRVAELCQAMESTAPDAAMLDRLTVELDRALGLLQETLTG